jgi:hypothetical protein
VAVEFCRTLLFRNYEIEIKKKKFCLADGITYSFGIFLVELITVFDADRGAVSLIPSILVGITLGSGKSRGIINYKNHF